jgi:hypothetical protein
MKTQRFLNKSALIEAIQFTGNNLDDILEFVENTNVISATILNNVLYLIVQTHDKAEVQRWNLLPKEYLIKDASGYVSSLDEEIILRHWYPLNTNVLINM